MGWNGEKIEAENIVSQPLKYRFRNNFKLCKIHRAGTQKSFCKYDATAASLSCKIYPRKYSAFRLLVIRMIGLSAVLYCTVLSCIDSTVLYCTHRKAQKQIFQSRKIGILFLLLAKNVFIFILGKLKDKSTRNDPVARRLST